jgi:uncharacterized protein DUF1416
MCGAPEQTATLPAGVDPGKETVLTGRVLAGDETPVGGAYVRLLDESGEFTAEVVSSGSGDFRFFAAPGTWTVRVLHRSGTGSASVVAEGPGLYPVNVTIG